MKIHSLKGLDDGGERNPVEDVLINSLVSLMVSSQARADPNGNRFLTNESLSVTSVTGRRTRTHFTNVSTWQPFGISPYSFVPRTMGGQNSHHRRFIGRSRISA